MTRFIPTTIDEMRFVIAAPRGRGAGRAGECDNQASAPANIETGPAKAFARRGFRLTPGERCGDHEVAAYLAHISDETAIPASGRRKVGRMLGSLVSRAA